MVSKARYDSCLHGAYSLMRKILNNYMHTGSYSVQFSCSVVSDSVTPWTAAHQASVPFAVSQSLLRSMSIESVMPSNHLVLCRLLLSLLWFFSNELPLRMRWPKYWSFNFSISPSNKHPGLISFRMDWLDLLAVQGTLHHHSSKASVLRCSAFFASPWTPSYSACDLIVVSLPPAWSTRERGCCAAHSCTWPRTASGR